MISNHNLFKARSVVRADGLSITPSLVSRGGSRGHYRIRTRASSSEQLTGIAVGLSLSNPDVRAELETVSKQSPTQSFARVSYHPDCEAAINEQINIEYNVSYIYHSLYAYFKRDNVALPGMAAFFKDGSEEEREHAELLMDYQNKRGGRVKLKSILMPEVEFDHPEKGEALYAMELALSLEKLNFQKLRELHAVAAKHEDPSMTDFIEGNLLAEQEEAVKQVSEYVSQLRRVGKGLGVFQFDRELAAKKA